MYKITFKLCIVFCIVSPSFRTQNVRKYKVQEEALKLFKQDFKSVLKRFRRTSDYLKILQDKLADLKTSTREMNLQVLHYYHGKMEEHVAATLPNTTSSQPRSFRATIDEKYNNYFRAYGNRKQLADPVPAEEPHEEEWQKINNLDNYYVFNSHLSVPERNNMKELGFYYAGQVIHSIIENLQPLTAAERVTKPPEENDIVKKFSTQHPKTHQKSIIQTSTSKKAILASYITGPHLRFGPVNSYSARKAYLLDSAVMYYYGRSEVGKRKGVQVSDRLRNGLGRKGSGKIMIQKEMVQKCMEPGPACVHYM